MNKHWEEDIRQRLSGHEEEAPELSWTEIEAALAERGKAHQAHIVQLWARRTAAAAAILFIVGGVGVYRLNSFDKSKEEPICSSVGGVHKAPAFPTPSTAEPTCPDIPRKAGQVASAGKLTAKAEMAIADAPDGVAAKDDAVDEGMMEEKRATANGEQTPRHNTHKKKSLDEGMAITTVGQRPAHGLMAQAWLGGGSGGSGGGGLVMVGADAPFASYTQNNMQDGGIEKVASTSDAPTHTCHRTPLQLGVGLRRRLSDKWSLATGITYAYLGADLDYADGSKGKQGLHYVGVPVQASYSLWQAKRTSVYVSVGGEVQKMVYGKRTVTDNLTADATERTERLHENSLQLSANVAVGIECAVVGGASLYAEPGLNYSFDNGGTIPTLYKDSPLNFNMNLGIRFNIK